MLSAGARADGKARPCISYRGAAAAEGTYESPADISEAGPELKGENQQSHKRASKAAGSFSITGISKRQEENDIC